MGAEPESQETLNANPHFRQLCHWFGWTFVLIFIIYPLSFGPAIWLFQKGALPAGIFVVYVPLGHFNENFKPAGELLGWYLSTFWGWNPPNK